MKPEAWFACARKQPYSEKSADRAIARNRKMFGLTMSKYRCKFCPNWHLTKKAAA